MTFGAGANAARIYIIYVYNQLLCIDNKDITVQKLVSV